MRPITTAILSFIREIRAEYKAARCDPAAAYLLAWLAEIHQQHIWRFLRAQKIDLSGRKSWRLTADPAFVPKATDIVGLRVNPPDNAMALSVDERPSIQAPEHAQGYRKLRNGRAMIGQSQDYKRNGAATLLAALDVSTEQVGSRHYKHRRRLNSLDFMKRAVKQYQGRTSM